MATNADLPRQPKPLQQTFRSSKPRRLLALVAVLLLILIVPGIGGYLLGQRNSRPAFPSQSFISPEVKISTTITQSASIANLPPDPGEAGKATVAGIDSDHDGVRDDVQRYIELTVTDSARHREALKNVARNTQRELLAQTKEESIQRAIEGVRTIECLGYLGVLNQDKWEEVEALMLNTKERLLANEAHNDRINGQVFPMLPDNLKRSACEFDVEALPN